GRVRHSARAWLRPDPGFGVRKTNGGADFRAHHWARFEKYFVTTGWTTAALNPHRAALTLCGTLSLSRSHNGGRMAGSGASGYIVAMAPASPSSGDPRRRRFRRIPVRTLAPNMVTLLAMCAGLTAIRMAFEGRYMLALAAIVFAAILDGIDGRLARFLKGTSRFGAELDSLSDFVNFGVAPALVVYFWGLHDLKSAGWIAAMVFAICGGLRLARFNVMAEEPDRPAWASNFFVGMPAPMGAITVLLPIYVTFLGVPHSSVLNWSTLFYTLVIALLMISRLPVYSGKRVGTRVPPEMVGPVIVIIVLSIGLLIAYPWILLPLGTLAYLGSLPFGLLSYRRYQQRSREPMGEGIREATRETTLPPPPVGSSGLPANDQTGRPSRLN